MTSKAEPEPGSIVEGPRGGLAPAINDSESSRGRKFLAVPAEEVAALRQTLGVYLAAPRVDQVLREFGRRVGRNVASLDPEAPDVGSAICRLGAQVGLGRFSFASETEAGLPPTIAGVGGPGGPEASWAIRCLRLAELEGISGRAPQPAFTAGFLEGAFEAMLGTRVEGVLLQASHGVWVLRVELLARLQARSESGSGFRIPKGRAYRLEVTEEGEFFDKLVRLVIPGATLGFTREAPHRLRSEYGLKSVELHWLASTYRPGESVLPARQFGRMVRTVEDFLARHGRPALVFLQGLDYLADRNDPRSVVRLVEILRERVVSGEGSLVVELPVEALELEWVGRIRRELAEPLPTLD